jgi:hypothetical protein
MFAKLTSTKLTSNRVSRQARPELRLEPVPRVAPAHANDNRARRHVGDVGRPVLTCLWIPSAAGGLECRWMLADGEPTRPEESGDAARVQRPAALGGRRPALVVG